MRRPEGTCASCWQPHPPSQERCFGPPEATERTYGETTTDRLESFLLDATNPRQDVATRAHGFQIDEAKRLAGWLRSATADGSLTADDFGLPAPPSTPVEGRPDDLIERLRDANGIEDLNHDERTVRSLLAEAADALGAPVGGPQPDELAALIADVHLADREYDRVCLARQNAESAYKAKQRARIALADAVLEAGTT